MIEKDDRGFVGRISSSIEVMRSGCSPKPEMMKPLWLLLEESFLQ